MSNEENSHYWGQSGYSWKYFGNLELSNYQVYTAPNGKEGVAKALANKPDLIVCDIMMPELDGYGVLHMLQKNPDLQDTPFIFLTAKTEGQPYRL